MTDDNYRALVARLRAMCGIPEAAADAIEALMARAERAEAALREALEFIDDPYNELAIYIGGVLAQIEKETGDE